MRTQCFASLLPPPFLTSWFPPVETALATGQDLGHSWRGQRPRMQRVEAGSGKLFGQSLRPLLWGLRCVSHGWCVHCGWRLPHGWYVHCGWPLPHGQCVYEENNCQSRILCKLNVSHSVMSDSLGPPGPHPARLLCPWNFPGKNTGVGCHFL